MILKQRELCATFPEITDPDPIRQERYSGSMTRSFYVGDAVKQEDIEARMEHGVLKLTVPAPLFCAAYSFIIVNVR